MALGFNLSALPPLREYELERSFDEREALGWMRDNWQKSFFFAAAYVMLIFGTRHFMKERRGYKLRAPLTLWSLGLALFSAIGTHRSWKYMASITSSMGFKQSVCDQSFYVHHISKLWAYLFALSKVLELGVCPNVTQRTGLSDLARVARFLASHCSTLYIFMSSLCRDAA